MMAPHPANTSANVPMNSAARCRANAWSMARLETIS
jgi:hypothetical protein